MIDPSTITNFNLNKYKLQEMAIFWILVAGKTARTTARLLEKMLKKLHDLYGQTRLRPFDVIRKYDKDYPNGGLEQLMNECGIGCHTFKARGVRDLVNKDLDLKNCSVEELESVYFIGPKTARCFVMHTRPGVRHAGLDIHVLKFLASLGYKVPKNTPPRGRVYLDLENIFLQIADSLKTTAAELDLSIWNAYSTGGEYKITTTINLPKQG